MEGPDRFMFDPARNLQRPDDRGRVEQAAAICLRAAAQGVGFDVLLIASSTTGKWGLPKGHIEPGEASHETARREAYEEAGIEGRIAQTPCGCFTYRKPGCALEYRVMVHLLMVHGMCDHYPEEASRPKIWISLAHASREVANAAVSQILEQILQSHMEKVSAA
jgi:8-oxo-dGTP pyrophosphatase MutT (NUDIX family)